MTINGDITGTGGLTVPGAGKVIITSTNVNYNGDTTVNNGTLQINTSVIDLAAVSGTGTLAIGDGTDHNGRFRQNRQLDPWHNARLSITPIAGGYIRASSDPIMPVPEPSTLAMLMLAAMGLGIYWRRR